MKMTMMRVWVCAGIVALLSACAAQKSDTAGTTMTKSGQVEPVTLEFEGTIARIDADDGWLTVQRLPVSRTFQVPASCRVSMPDRPDAALADLQVDDPVTVAYTEVNGELVASRIAHGGMAAKREKHEQFERLDEMLNPSPTQ